MKLSKEYQRQFGIALMITGAAVLMVFAVFASLQEARITGIPEILPASGVAAYIEFPNHLKADLNELLEKITQINWNKNIKPLKSDSSALVFLKTDAEALAPALIFGIESGASASAEALGAKFIGGYAIIAPSAEALKILGNAQSPVTKKLSADPRFISAMRPLAGNIKTYIRIDELPDSVFFALGAADALELPFFVRSYSDIGISLDKTLSGWRGNTYAFADSLLPLAPPRAYGARLLSFVPDQFDLMLAGTDIYAQIKKLEQLTAADKSLPSVNAILESFGADEFMALLKGEFVFSAQRGKAIFITEFDERAAGGAENLLREKYARYIAGSAIERREIKMLDGETAYELIPRTSAPASGSFEIDGVTVHETGDIFDATINGMLLITNSGDMLEQSISLANGAGRSFRESNSYRELLQPILKNPELLGIARLEEFGTFSFSKRTYADHMETNFVIMQ